MSRLLLTLVFVCCFSMATCLAPAFERIAAKSGTSTSPLLMLLGDTRRLFANQFFAMADVYFHSGYYPTIFDRKNTGGPSHLDVATHENDTSEQGGKPAPPDDDDNFMGTPRDWVERFGRHFIPTIHKHLQNENAREILPWIKLSAEMDPTRVETYVTASYWLRSNLNKPKEAEQFLREGLRANPDSYDILLELGRVYFYNENNPTVARNLWDAGLRKWNEQDKAGQNPNPHARDELLGEMVRDDEKVGDLRQLLTDLEALDKTSPGKSVVEKYIQDVKAKLAKQSAPK